MTKENNEEYMEMKQASEAVKPNFYVMINSRPCKILDLSKSKPGKHGSAKLNYTGIDIFTGNKLLGTCPTSTMLQVPIVTRTEYTVLDITEDGYLSLLTDDGKSRDDVKLTTSDVCIQLKDKFLSNKIVILTLMESCGEEAIVSFKIEDS